jgi:hypothetical protein
MIAYLTKIMIIKTYIELLVDSHFTVESKKREFVKKVFHYLKKNYNIKELKELASE